MLGIEESSYSLAVLEQCWCVCVRMFLSRLAPIQKALLKSLNYKESFICVKLTIFCLGEIILVFVFQIFQN